MYKHLTYRICRKDDRDSVLQLKKLGEMVIMNPATERFYDDMEGFIEYLKNKHDFALFGAFEEDHKTMVAGMSMYDLHSNTIGNEDCAKAFGFDTNREKNVMIVDFFAVSFLYLRTSVIQDIINYAYRWAKRQQVHYIIGTVQNVSRSKISEAFSGFEVNFSEPFIHVNSKGQMSVCSHFCIGDAINEKKV